MLEVVISGQLGGQAEAYRAVRCSEVTVGGCVQMKFGGIWLFAEGRSRCCGRRCGRPSWGCHREIRRQRPWECR